MSKVILPAADRYQRLQSALPWAIVALAILMLVSKSFPPSPSKFDGMDLYGFGQIPVQHNGRIQPLDTVARTSLMIISTKQEFEDTADNDKTYKAIEWLLIVWAQPDRADKFRIFRTDHPQVLALMGLPQRPGSYRYSLDELRPGQGKLFSQAEVAERKDPEKRDHYDVKVLELVKHIRVYEKLADRQAPGLIPLEDPKAKWLSVADAFVRVAQPQEGPLRTRASAEIDASIKEKGGLAGMEQRFGKERVATILNQLKKERFLELLRQTVQADMPTAFPAAATMEQLLDAYRDSNAAAFNAALAVYQNQHTPAVPPEQLSRVRAEARMNHFDPFLQCMALYVAVGVLAALSWLVWEKPLNRAALLLACLTLLVHTAALATRMYIGNRPPVTNLYSSAIFIGWGCLILCLILEAIFQIGVGSVAAGILGFSTMMIARFLAESGDTLEMLQAVLDTNFWLATHVVAVTLGYVATFVAGLIGIIYIVRGLFTTALSGELGKKIAGMMYGTICFATLLSFTGTVLGGIWADQSWGRFWGWDPKENGAVLIVIWNALILHARWGGLVKARGMAILAVAGNMWTAWSWFGTNQLGIGLHAYGFDNRLATGCALFWLSQVLIIGLGLVPTRFWASFDPNLAAKGKKG